MITPELARGLWYTLEPLHGMIYFVPEAPEAYAARGVADPGDGYFASRSAPLGRVPAETVVACFYNFCPDLVRHAIPAVWEVTTPQALVEARQQAADKALRRAFGEALGSPALAKAAALLRVAAEAACLQPEGRPLFSAYAPLPWPDEPHSVLFHAQTLLREFRGDGHLAALLIEGLSGLEALILHAATGEVSLRFLRASRGWPDEIWEAAVDLLRTKGLLTNDDGLSLSDSGKEMRQRIEDRTDAASLPAYSALGRADAERLLELGAPLAASIFDAGLLRRPRKRT